MSTIALFSIQTTNNVNNVNKAIQQAPRRNDGWIENDDKMSILKTSSLSANLAYARIPNVDSIQTKRASFSPISTVIHGNRGSLSPSSLPRTPAALVSSFATHPIASK